MENKMKVCLIGCGVISDNHIISLSMLDSVEIVALCDVIPEKAEIKKEKHSLSCNIYSDYIEMLDSEKPDAVHIMTPHYLHTEMTLEALKRNINVFLEKPLCIKKEDIEKIINAEKESDAIVCVSFQTRYNETVRLAKQIADKDGGVSRAHATLMWNRDDAYYAQGEWRGKWSTEGGGVLINQAIHTLDLLCIFLGIPKNVQAVCSKLCHSPEVEVEDAAECMIEFENGKRAILFATNNFSGQDSTTLYLETENHTVVIREPNIYLDGEKLMSANTDTYMGKECYGNSHIYLIKDFYESLSSGKGSPIPPAAAQHALKILLGAYESNGKTIQLV